MLNHIFNNLHNTQNSFKIYINNLLSLIKESSITYKMMSFKLIGELLVLNKSNYLTKLLIDR